MFLRKTLIAAAGLLATASWTAANAYEAGYPGAAQKPGVTLGGGSAGDPPPGIYMFDQFFTYQAMITGPGSPRVGGNSTTVHLANETNGFLFVPGWTFLGATYDAVIVQPFNMVDISTPVNAVQAGAHNTYIVPVELSWKLADSGFFIKTGLGMYVPDGSVSGANGLGNVGAPFWTYQPEFVVSYLKDGWNLTANIFEEFNTKNTVTGYTSGDVLHAEFTATKTFGNWTIGPVAYYAGQVSNDTSSAFYGGLVNTNKFDTWAGGALVGYNFGPVQLNVWALSENTRAAGGTLDPFLTGTSPNAAYATQGYSVFAQLSYRLWAPDAPAAPKKPMIYK